MKLGSWLIVIGLGCSLALTTGCILVAAGAGAAAGVGTYAYVRGELKSTLDAPLDRTWRATQTAVKDLKFAVIKEQKDALQAELTARTAADKKVLVKLVKLTNNTTEVRVRVGTFGDESLSRLILEKIKANL